VPALNNLLTFVTFFCIHQDKAALQRQLARVEEQLASSVAVSAASGCRGGSCHNYKAPINASEAGAQGWWWGGTELQMQTYREGQSRKARSLPAVAHVLCKMFMPSLTMPLLPPQDLGNCAVREQAKMGFLKGEPASLGKRMYSALWEMTKAHAASIYQ